MTAARAREPVAVLTGDSLFVGDVARPDLAVEPTEGARELYRSLHERLFALPETVEVWPGHLGGSLCGGSGLDHRTSSTIGFELRHNHAAEFADVDDFVAEAISTLASPPPNVEHVVALNRGPLLEQLGTPMPLSPRAVESAIAEGAVLIDARTNDQFDEAHIPGAISASAYDTGFGTKVANTVVRRRRADRRRRLRRLRARGGRAARLGRAAGARIPRRGDDRLAIGGAAGRQPRADRRRRARPPARLERRAGGARRARRRRVRRRPHPRLDPHPLLGARAAASPSFRATAGSRPSAAAASAPGSPPRSSPGPGSPSRCTSATAGWRAGGAPDARWSPRDKGAPGRERERRGFLRGRATPVPRAVCRACAEGVPAPATSGGRISLLN